MCEIRKLTVLDSKDIFKISKKCFNDYWSYEDTIKIFDNKSNYYIGIFNGDIMLGYAGIMVLGDEADLINIAILKEHRNRGLASILMKEILKDMINLKLTCMTLEVRSSNLEAINLYKKLEFENIAIRKNYYKKPIEDAIIMQYKIH